MLRNVTDRILNADAWRPAIPEREEKPNGFPSGFPSGFPGQRLWLHSLVIADTGIPDEIRIGVRPLRGVREVWARRVRDNQIPRSVQDQGNITLNVLPGGLCRKQIATPCVVTTGRKGIPNRPAELAGDQDSHASLPSVSEWAAGQSEWDNPDLERQLPKLRTRAFSVPDVATSAWQKLCRESGLQSGLGGTRTLNQRLKRAISYTEFSRLPCWRVGLNTMSNKPISENVAGKTWQTSVA